jgi:hypothetical protein
VRKDAEQRLIRDVNSLLEQYGVNLSQYKQPDTATLETIGFKPLPVVVYVHLKTCREIRYQVVQWNPRTGASTGHLLFC